MSHNEYRRHHIFVLVCLRDQYNAWTKQRHVDVLRDELRIKTEHSTYAWRGTGFSDNDLARWPGFVADIRTGTTQFLGIENTGYQLSDLPGMENCQHKIDWHGREVNQTIALYSRSAVSMGESKSLGYGANSDQYSYS